MTKLKTLKDIPTVAADSEFLFVKRDELRQEAIKQIREGTFDPVKFFNLTDEDLK